MPVVIVLPYAGACLHTVKPLLLLQGSVKTRQLLFVVVYFGAGTAFFGLKPNLWQHFSEWVKTHSY
ncbi:hypothetical protein BVG80_00235 [Sphingobacteriales bacterium TSM_CSM]|nr:hypothetical protein BVG80_00235 [Sphingobacteriales bacterium TSM_CSM]